jgi:hypothetical protein
MAREPYELTAEVQQAIVAYVRAGGYPHVAAEAAGVPGRVFERWLRQAAQGDERFRALAEAVRQARAQARLGAEVAARNERPMDWLRSGPGKQTADSPGWTGAVRAAGYEGDGSVLLAPEAQALFHSMLDALAAFPEARLALAGVVALPPERPEGEV